MIEMLSVACTSSEAYSRRNARFWFEAGVGRRPHVRREPNADAIRESRADVEVAARDVERVVSVRFVQLRLILQERQDAKRHRRKAAADGHAAPGARAPVAAAAAAAAALTGADSGTGVAPVSAGVARRRCGAGAGVGAGAGSSGCRAQPRLLSPVPAQQAQCRWFAGAGAGAGAAACRCLAGVAGFFAVVCANAAPGRVNQTIAVRVIRFMRFT